MHFLDEESKAGACGERFTADQLDRPAGARENARVEADGLDPLLQERAGKLYRARSRLYRSQLLQVISTNTHLNSYLVRKED